MNCEQFLLKIDAYIDGELSDNELMEMRAHAENCEACCAEMEKADLLRDTLKGLDDDIVVPLEAQAAWRKAVRAEAQRKNVRKWTRGLYVVAAALVLVLGCTLLMNNDIFASRRMPADTLPSAKTLDEIMVIAADGEDEQAAVASETYSAVMKYAVADMKAADTLIRNLAAEYESLSVERVDLGENAFYCVEMPFDYQQDFLSSLSVLGSELSSDIFEVEMENAIVRINLIAE